ncbi:MAG: hypothetical protein KY458_04310 [Actinobacteria bacterium]|nr:hypothetical protein [Actinomycetota bacterium]
MTRAAAGAALAVVLLLAAPAFACTPSADFSVGTGSSKSGGTTNASAPAGATVPFEGNNWDGEGMPVKVLWNEAGSDSSRLLFAVAPDAKGSFRVAATIPADTRPGFYELRAEQVRSNDTKKVSYLQQGRLEVLEPGQQPVTEESQPQTPPQESGQPAPEQSAPRAEAAPAAAASPAAPAAPRARPAAPARNAATAPAAAPAAPADAAPVAAAPEEPAAAVAVVEPEAAPSVKSTTADLWSGFNGRSAGQVPSLAAPVEQAPAKSLAGGIALLMVGTLTLLAGVGVATLRRTRARAQG